MNTDFRFYDDPYEIFFRAYHKDRNLCSKNELFVFRKKNEEYLSIPDYTELNPITIERYIKFNNLSELNKIFHYPNTYGLWSDFIKEQSKSNHSELFKENEDPNELDHNLISDSSFKKSNNSLLRKLSSSSKRINLKPEISKLYVMHSLCSKRMGYKPYVDKLVVKKQSLHDFDNIRNLDNAFEFLDKYGTDYPTSEYVLFRFTINLVEVSSYDTNDQDILFKVGKDALANRSHENENKNEVVYETQLNEKVSLSDQNAKLKFRIKFFKRNILPPFFDRTPTNQLIGPRFGPFWKKILTNTK